MDYKAKKSKIFEFIVNIFIKVGVLPFFLLGALIVFSTLSHKFLTEQNLINVIRQSVYLILVSMGQMLVLISGGFDLSVGMVVALTSVVSALVMVWLMEIFPDAIGIVVLLGIFSGFGVALIVGIVNGVGIAYFGISPFIMTLGVSSIGTGISLFLTGGVPVSDLPFFFSDVLGFGRFLNVPIPVIIVIVCIVIMWLFMFYTRLGTQIYAVGGNIKAAHLSAINTKKTLILVYVICSLIASLMGILLTARIDSGEANLGGSIALESIAACVIAGVSLRGGIGKVGAVVLGGFFIVLVQNGMNLVQISSYMQMVLLGCLLILAVVFDQVRYRIVMGK